MSAATIVFVLIVVAAVAIVGTRPDRGERAHGEQDTTSPKDARDPHDLTPKP